MSEKRMKTTKMKPPRRSSQISDTSSSSESTSSFSSDDEETDVRDLKPIKDYLYDRRQLAAQLFKSVKLEKIRMMLPQALKNINLYDIEEWCGNELSGMSGKRILSIINGKRMVDSSDTDETDDSGPSLEIISDTEEWFSDDDVIVKEENSTVGKSKSKKNADKVKGKSRPIPTDKSKAKANPKASNNSVKDKKAADVSVKVEGKKPEPKEGETLLDLLELEMRARAIRALIRKEEDIIPGKTTAGTSSKKNGTVAPANANSSGSKYIVQEMQQISVALKEGSGLDDDVMLVIQPAPTIELLSSDSENEKEKEKDKDKKEDSARVNQRSESERDTEKEENRERTNQRLEEEREIEKGEENEDSKPSKEHEHLESKRVNKRLENERGTETTRSTSTIGDEVMEIIDNEELKKEESPAGSEKNETEPVIEERVKSEKSPEEVVDKEADKLDKSVNETLTEGIDKTSNKTDNITDETRDNVPEKSPENVLEKENTDAKQDDQKKLQDKSEKEEEKGTIDLENVLNEQETDEKPPDKRKSPGKELEEGELTSDSEEEAPLIDINVEKRMFNKNVQRKRHIRSKVHESSEESEHPDESETAGLGSEENEKVRDASKAKFKSRKRIRGLTSSVKRTGSKEKVKENMEDNMQDFVVKEEKEALNEIERQEEKKNELKRNQEDAEKDMEEIIDLDDYPDDMDDLENNENSKLGDSKKSIDTTVPQTSAENSEPAETWASRYYNTDDVQNVIKESKIHSEIRKRLRERQRIYKLNSPSMIIGSSSPIDIKTEEAKQKPLGSVEEYLALKAASVAESRLKSTNEKSEVLLEKSTRPGRKGNSSHKSKSHTSRRRSKSDKKSANVGVSSRSTGKKKEKEMTVENSEARLE